MQGNEGGKGWCAETTAMGGPSLECVNLVQGSAKFLFPGSFIFGPALAYQFFLDLPATCADKQD